MSTFILGTHEKREQKHAKEKWKLGVTLMNDLFEDLGVYKGWNGFANPADYETMVVRVRECKERFLQRVAKTAEEQEEWIKAWPFEDKE